jgi:outer membrane lipoprotein carrier protein
VTASFRQTVTYDVSGITKDSDGGVWLEKPGKMRWDYYEKKTVDGKPQQFTKKSFISDGTTGYLVEHDNKQVVRKSVNQDLMPVAVSFLYGKGDLATEFNAEVDTTGKWGDKDDIVLKLTPKQPSAQYKTLFLVVHRNTDYVSQSIVIDAGKNVNQFRFFNIDFQKSVEDKWFSFDPRSVPNYRIVDGDNLQGSAAGSGAVKM